jgi:hypothetical protein
LHPHHRACLGDSLERPGMPPGNSAPQHPAQQAGSSTLPPRAAHTRRQLPPAQPHRARLAIVGGDHRGRLPSPLPHEIQKFLPPLGMLSDDGNCGVERITIAEVMRGHSKVALNLQQVARGFCREAKTDSPGILFSHFLRRRKSKSGFNGERGVTLAASDFSDMPRPRARNERGDRKCAPRGCRRR